MVLMHKAHQSNTLIRLIDIDENTFFAQGVNHLRSELETPLQLTNYVVHSYSRLNQFLVGLGVNKALAPALLLTDML